MKCGKVYTWENRDDAKCLIGKKVLYSDNYCAITTESEKANEATLIDVRDCDYPFFLSSPSTCTHQFIREIDRPLTPQEFAEEMKRLAMNNDTEGMHSDMDELMCETLKALGYEEGVEIFENTDKWYA